MNTTEQQYIAAAERGDTALTGELGARLEAATRADHERLTAAGALGKAALWYARHGVAVFPCQPRGKQPATAHGFKDASTDPDTIRDWWAERPDANIGAPTGLLFDVIDIDGPEGVQSIYGTGASIKTPPELGHSLTSRTAGHHLFIAPTGRGNRASFLPGVDYRGAGGYVILPPSIGANGVRYTWTRPLQLATA